MRIAVILPHLPDLSGESGTSSISGASIALKVFLRLYANDPGVETLELFVAPRDLLNPAAIRKLAADLLEPSNLGKGKLEFHSLYSLPELWSDGHARVIHTDDLHALARDRDLRDRFATGPTVIACDIHCMGHRSISDSIRLVAQMPSNRFDRIYATSHASARSTEATFKAIGAPGHTVIEVRPRMIDGTGLRPCANPGEKAALRRTLGFSESDVVALVVGRMTPATKADFVVLTEVFAAQSRPSHHLVIAGHEEIIGYGKTVYDTAVKHGAAGRVHVRGGFGIGARGDLYRASDFLVFPADSGNEVFGQAAVEAMACGIPVLATDWDGLKDTVEDGVTGIRVPTYAPPRLGRFDSLTSVADDLTTLLLRAQATVVDRSAFGSAFEKLLNDAELRARMGIAGAAVFHTKFLPEMLYRELTASFREQLEIAAQESPTDRSVRRQWGLKHSQEVPAFEQFEAYGTRNLLSLGHWFQTTAKGRDALMGYQAVELVPEVSAVLPTVVIELLLSKLVSGKNSSEFEALALTASLPPDLVTFGLAVLCKRGYIDVRSTQP